MGRPDPRVRQDHDRAGRRRIRLELLDLAAASRSATTPTRRRWPRRGRDVRVVAGLPYPVQLAREPGRAIAAPAGSMVASVIRAAWRHGTVRVSLDVGAFHGLIEALESAASRASRSPSPRPASGRWSVYDDWSQLRQPGHDHGPGSATGAAGGDQGWIGNAGAYTTCYSGRSCFKNVFPAPGVRIVRQGGTPRPVRDHERSGLTVTMGGCCW